MKYDLGWDDGYKGFPMPEDKPDSWDDDDWSEYKAGYYDGENALASGYVDNDSGEI